MWLENRRKLIAGLREPGRKKHKGELEDILNPDARCCLGHGCQILGIERKVTKHQVFYGGQSGVAPDELIAAVGLRCSTGYLGKTIQWRGYTFNSLTELNDNTDATPAEIADFLEETIEGGEGSPFLPLSDEKLAESGE